MKTNIVFSVCLLMISITLTAQVTQINADKSLHVRFPIDNTKTIVVSNIDSSIWVTDATLLGTVQISPDIKFEEFLGFLSGSLIFTGSTATTGSEVYKTDGTPAGTVLVKDIFAGATSSSPSEGAILNGFCYFTATTAAEGRELWRTDGTTGGTTLVKDIVAGAGSSNAKDKYNLFSNGSYLLFAAKTATLGVELWISDGTSGGTTMLKDINSGNSGADSSNPADFYVFNNLVLFIATDAPTGEEVWKTDGTPGGTTILKDINPGSGSSTSVELFPGFSFPIFLFFHTFNNHVFFGATDGTSTGEVWSTDGTTANTTLLKDIIPGTGIPFILLVDAVNYPGIFIFPISDGTSRSELWQSDGTPGGTVLFKSFTPITAGPPLIFVPFAADLNTQTFTQPFFQGNKFFFTGGTSTEGNELWISDGTLAGTSMVKDIYAGTGDGINISNGISYLYTTGALFFKGTTAAQGDELWKSDGTSAGTAIVQDIYPGTGNAAPELTLVTNFNKIIFSATDGSSSQTDLFVVDGTFLALPVKIIDFTVARKAADALLQWTTAQEINSKDFTIQRSYDGQHFENIGIVQATGTTSNRHGYSFTDAGIANSGKDVVYYRLLASTKDGKTENTNIISLKLGSNRQWNVRLLSNPVLDNLKILLSETTGRVQFTVRDLNGRLIYSNSVENLNGEITLPVDLQRGVYILVAENNNERKTLKFVK